MANSRRGAAWYQRAGVWIGIATGPGTFTVGGALSAQMPLASLLFIIPIGALALTGLTVAQAIVSRRRGEPSPERVIGSFGPNLGAALLNVIVALGTLGWFSFYVGLAGFSVATLLDLPGWIGALIVALALFLLNALGLNRWNAFVWLTAISTVGVALSALLGVGTQWSPDQSAAIGVGQFLWATGSVVSYGLLFALRVGDFSWDLASDREVLKAGIALFIPFAIFLTIGALVYRAVGDWNIADVLARSESTALGNLFLIASVIAPSMSGFHSGALAISSFSPIGKRTGYALIAALGFVLGALRFDHQLLLFLDLLGACIAPALVVMLLMAALKHHPSRASALAAWLLGSAAALFSKWQGELSPVLVGAGVSIVALTASIGWARITTRALQIERQE